MRRPKQREVFNKRRISLVQLAALREWQRDFEYQMFWGKPRPHAVIRITGLLG